MKYAVFLKDSDDNTIEIIGPYDEIEDGIVGKYCYEFKSNSERNKGNMKKVKITVLRKEFYSDFAKEYLTDGKDGVI